MPVDLSRIGLEGIETAQRTLNSMQARESAAIEDMVKLGTYQQKEKELALDQWASQELSNIAVGDGSTTSGVVNDDTDFADLFDRIGSRYIAGGAPKRGVEMIEAGMKLRSDRADLEKTGYDTDKVRLENISKTADWVANNIGDNESEFKLFLSQLDNPNNAFIRNNIGEENIEVLKNTPWSPDLANFFKSKAISIKDQANLGLAERRALNAEKATANSARIAEANLQIAEARAREQKRTNDLREREMGSNVGKPSTNAEIATAKSVILNTVKALEGADIESAELKPSIDHMAETVAGRAKVIVSENKGITYAEAVEQAVMESEAAGDFASIEVATSRLFGLLPDKKETKADYKRNRYNRDKPATLPKGDPKTVASKLVRGQFYQTPMGVLRWNGTDFDE